MNRYTQQELILNGLSSIDTEKDVSIEYDNYSNFYSTQIVKFLQYNNYKEVGNKSVGKDFEVGLAEWVKKSQEELDSENMDLQIKRIENQFNIKISYEKN